MKKSNIKNRIRGAYFTSVVSISLVLLLLGIVGLLMLNAKQMSDYVKENLCFSLIINDEVSEPDIKQFQKSLDTHEFIKSTEYITKISVISRKAIKIQKSGTFICKCHFFCVSLQPKNVINRSL